MHCPAALTCLLSPSALLAGLVLSLPSQPFGSQAPVQTWLRPATARLDEEFTRIVGLRELGDGRVLVGLDPSLANS